MWERCRERKRAQCYSTTVSDELPLEIEKVRKDGWVFRKPYEPGYYDSDDEHESTYWDALTTGPCLFPSSSSGCRRTSPSSAKSARRSRA